MQIFVTTSCHLHGHPEFTLQYANEVPVPKLERALLAFFEGRVATGTRFAPDQNIRFGSSLLRLIARADATLGVLELDLPRLPEWVESVDQTLLAHWQQLAIAESVGLVDEIDFPLQHQPCLVCNQALASPAIYLARSTPEDEEDTGWFIACTDEAHAHDSPDTLAMATLYQVAAAVPPLQQFFALPAGCEVLVVGPGQIQARVRRHGQELTPAPGSYFAALNSDEP